MNCKTCKHFARGGEYRRKYWGGTLDTRLVTDEAAKTGLCLHLAVRCDYVDGWDGRVVDGEEPSPRDAPHDGVYASCDESRGMLCVGEDFGCIHHSSNGCLT